MPDPIEAVKTGSIVGTIIAGVVAILYAIGHFISPKDNYRDLKNDPRIRDYIAEHRDDQILEALRDMKDCINSNERLLRNIRDIAADTARANNIKVHYDNE